MQHKTFVFVPGNIPTFSGLLGPTITEMVINFALEMLFRFSEPVFVFFAPYVKCPYYAHLTANRG